MRELPETMERGITGFRASIQNAQSRNVGSLSEESGENPSERAREALAQTSRWSRTSNLAPGQGSRVDVLA